MINATSESMLANSIVQTKNVIFTYMCVYTHICVHVIKFEQKDGE